MMRLEFGLYMIQQFEAEAWPRKQPLMGAVFESAEVPIVVGDVGVHVTAEWAEDGEIRGTLFGELNRGGGA